jgi:hypothetical protein
MMGDTEGDAAGKLFIGGVSWQTTEVCGEACRRAALLVCGSWGLSFWAVRLLGTSVHAGYQRQFVVVSSRTISVVDVPFFSRQ